METLSPFIAFLTDEFQRSNHEIPGVIEVMKDNWSSVRARAELFSVRCHRNGLMQPVQGGGEGEGCQTDV